MANEESSSSSYESDFEEDSKSSEERNDEDKTRSVEECDSDNDNSTVKSCEEEGVTFDDDDNVFDIIPDKSSTTALENSNPVLKRDPLNEKTSDKNSRSQLQNGVKKWPKEKEEDQSKDKSPESKEIMEFEEEYDVSEDIRVEEDYLANHLDEYVHVEAIEPLEKDEKQKKKIGHTLVKNSTAATKCTDGVRPYESQPAKRGNGRKDEQKQGQNNTSLYDDLGI